MTDVTLSAAQRALLRKWMSEGGRPLVPRIGRRPEGEPVPLSLPQRRLWFMEKLSPGLVAHHLPLALHFEGHLDVACATRALHALVRRHEALRTGLVERDGEARQVVSAEAELAVPVHDLRPLPEDERPHRAVERMAIEVQATFDLAQPPLVRACFLHLSETRHILLLTIHHVIADGWTLTVLVRELCSLYEGLATGRPAVLPPLPIQYGDFAVWQLQQDHQDVHVRYWTSHLAGTLPTTTFPPDLPRPAVKRWTGARRPLSLPPEAVSRLRAVAQRENATLFMTLLAAFDVLVHRYTGQSDLLIGSPIANRSRAELEGVVGLFFNTIVLRAGLEGNPTFRELLGRVRAVTTAAYEHQDLPFEALVDALRPERDLSRNPLFQVMFVLQDGALPDQRIHLPGLEVTFSSPETRTAQFDLTVNLWESRAGGVEGWIDYDTNLYTEATIDRIAAHYASLVEAVAEDPERRLADLSPLTVAERQQMVVEWNDTEVAHFRGRCLHHLFDAQVERTPEHDAVVFEGRRLTYRALWRRANRLAHHLRRSGIGPEDCVAVCLDRSADMVVALLAVLKAGGAYLPLDPAHPPRRLSRMCERAGARGVITMARHRPDFLELGGVHVCLDENEAEIAACPDDAPLVGTKPGNAAYVIFTSGSTGEPKGAVNTHEGVCNNLLWMQDAYGLQADDIVLQKTPYTFDVSVWELFWPLITGAGLVVARPRGHLDPAYLVDLISTEHVTTMPFVPSMLQVFLDEPRVRQCTSLRRVICIGEALPPELQQRFFSLMTTELHNTYGPTEAAVAVTAWACSAEDTRPAVPIGRPIANTRIAIVDAWGAPAPAGVAGELLIGGVGLARGYAGRPALTAERFVPDPFSGVPGARLYRTGDLATYLPDGNIAFLGRLDHQVKIRGFRVETGEVEAALVAHPGVREAVVLLREDSPGDRRLVAYAVLATDASPTVSDLRAFLGERLPDYMVPAAFVFVDRMPLNANGKLDRRALPVPPALRPSLEAAYAPPEGEIQRTVARIWEEVLQVDRVGIDDNFFDLGGDSLLMERIHHALRAALRKDVALIDLFKHATVRSLSAYLEGREATTSPLESVQDRTQRSRAALNQQRRQALQRRGDR